MKIIHSNVKEGNMLPRAVTVPSDTALVGEAAEPSVLVGWLEVRNCLCNSVLGHKMSLFSML